MAVAYSRPLHNNKLYCTDITMSDWLTLLTTFITALIPTGGLATIVTLRDKKTAAALDNVKTVVGRWQEIVEDCKTRAGEL